jgi:hypothetical protein
MINIDPNILSTIFNVIVADMHIAKDINEINIALQQLISTIETNNTTQIKENLQLFSQEIKDNMTKLILQTDTLCAAYDKLLQ